MGHSSAFKQHPKLKDYISWFEIPVYDIERATLFYNAIYNMEMEVGHNGEFAMSYFPAENGIGGALVQGPGCYPSNTGVLIYLNAGEDMDSILGRIELAGGRVIMPRMVINDTSGSFALFIDSEGNRLALHEGIARRGQEGGEATSVEAGKSAVKKPVQATATKKAKGPNKAAKPAIKPSKKATARKNRS